MRRPFLSVVVGLFVLQMPSVHAQNPVSTPSAETLPEGITLPKTGTVYALDTSEAHPKLLQLHASEIVSNSHAAGNAARSLIYVGAHASVELKGLNAAINLKNQRPSFYVRINSDDPEVMRTRLHLIRMEQTKDRRVVSAFSQNVFGGQRRKKYNDVAIEKADAETDIWLKVTPLAPLEPGEYGIVFMPADAAYAPEVVYDFDVALDSAAPVKK